MKLGIRELVKIGNLVESGDRSEGVRVSMQERGGGEEGKKKKYTIRFVRKKTDRKKRKKRKKKKRIIKGTRV